MLAPLAPFGSILLSKIALAGAPRKFQTRCREQKQAGVGNPQAKGSKIVPRNRKVGGIFIDSFEAFPAAFPSLIFNVCLCFYKDLDLFGCLRVFV